MALQVPVYQQQVRNSGPADTRLNVRANADTFGAAVGEGVSNIGKAGVDLALRMEAIAQQERQKAGRVVVDKAINDTAMKFSPVMAAARQTRGTDAMGASEKALPQFDKFADDAEAALATEDQRNEFRRWRMGERLQHQSALDNHAVLGQKQQDDENFAIDGTRFQKGIADNYTDAATLNRLILSRMDNIDAYADRNGKDSAWRNQATQESLSNAHSIVIARLIQDNNDVGAQKWLSQYAKQMNPDDLLKAQERVERASIDGQSKRFALQVTQAMPKETETPDLVEAQRIAEELTANSSQEVKDETLRRVYSQVTNQAAVYKSGQESTESKILDLAFGRRSVVPDPRNPDESFWSGPLGKDDPQVRAEMDKLGTERRIKMDAVFARAAMKENEVSWQQSRKNRYAIEAKLMDPEFRSMVIKRGPQMFFGIDDNPDLSKRMDWRMDQGDYNDIEKIVADFKNNGPLAKGIITREQAIKKAFYDAGLEGKEDKFNDADANFFRQLLHEEVKALSTGGKEPTSEQVDAAAKRLLVNFSLDQLGKGTVGTKAGEERAFKAMQNILSDLTPDEQAQVAHLSQKDGNTSIRRQVEIVNEYREMRRQADIERKKNRPSEPPGFKMPYISISGF